MVVAQAFTRCTRDARDRYFRNLRRTTYAKVLLTIEAAVPGIRGRVALTGFTPEVKEAMQREWMPAIREGQNDDPFNYRGALLEQFVSYEPPRHRIAEIPEAWAAHRFELAIWGDKQLCGLAVTGVQPRHDRNNVMAVELVVGAPRRNHPLRGRLGPILQFSALAWAAELGRDEVHCLGDFSSSGERMIQRTIANHGFRTEPRGDGESDDTIRFSVAKNLPLLKLP